jgi:hypothetical protein
LDAACIGAENPAGIDGVDPPNAEEDSKMGRSDSISDAALQRFYGDGFYRKQMSTSLVSARRYASILSAFFQPQSVVDLGCGRGTWLKAFKEIGAKRLVGYDGTWNSQDQMIDSEISFKSADLNELIDTLPAARFDLAMSLEVAEHLRPSAAETFVQSLTNFADVVMFGAAYPNQGGDNHINEQPASYWARLFNLVEYVPFDLFRPFVWGDADIAYWYQQNTFLYVRKNSDMCSRLAQKGHHPIQNIAFMDCVHPRLFGGRVGIKPILRDVAGAITPERLKNLARRIRYRQSDLVDRSI